MKISYNWLKNYLAVELDAAQVAEKLTAIGLEVEGMESFVSIPGGLEGLVVGLVQSAEQHPNADRLKMTAVDVGAKEVLQIVCGAPNVAAGQKVIVAQVGTELYPSTGDPFKIKRSKIRGVESQGMICAEDEIGVGAGHDGIVVLPDSLPIGKPLKEVYEVEYDTIFEIGLTANRSDAQSHIGVARDLAATLTVSDEKEYQVERPDLSSFSIDNRNMDIKVTVDNTEACPRYSGICFENVSVGPSPNWLQNKLKAIGVKAINNIVDITNFILHEYGQPLHAFDADKISGGQIIVKTLPQGSKFSTLDGAERSLMEDDLMICDQKGGLCIAGVYGGIDSGVTDDTSRIFLESAHFDSFYVRRTSTAHNLRTDAASRFEKGTDPNMTVDALKRAAVLIRELAGATIASEISDSYPNPVQAYEVPLRLSRLEKLVGIPIPEVDVSRILKALDIEEISREEDRLLLSVPTFKPDVLREIDLIEEILRIYGMDKIPLPDSLRSNTVHPPRPNPDLYRTSVSRYLAARGHYELFTNAIVSSELVNKFLPENVDQAVVLENSLNADLDVMRPTLLFGALESARHNINHRRKDVNLFEFGKVFWKEADQLKEREHLVLLISGDSSPESWRAPIGPVEFYDLKAKVFNILEKLGLSGNILEENSANSLLEYGLDLKRNEKRLVSFGAVQQDLLDGMEIKQTIFAAEFDWELLLKLAGRVKVEFSELNRFPTVRRDLALVLDKTVPYQKVADLAHKNGSRLLREVLLFDSYEGEHLDSGKKSYGIGLFFQDNKKTLTDKQVDKIMKQLIQSYEEELAASIRR